MKVKTVDGIEAIEGSYYYTDSGQLVILNKILCDQDFNNMFLVTPFYEGETMTASCDGGLHSECYETYEHEGEPFIVKHIFDKEPLDKLGKEFKAKQKELTDIAIVIGSMKGELSKINTLKVNTENKIECIKKDNKHLFDENERLNKLLEEAKEKINNARQKLSELEDSCEEYISEKTNKELAKLRKIEFKMQCLEAGGVDNWAHYGYSLDKYYERYPNG